MGHFRRAVWSSFLGGTLGGAIMAHGIALFFTSNSFGVRPWLFGLLILSCTVTGCWIAHHWLRTRLHPFALAESLGAMLGVWIALALISPPVSNFPTRESFVMDFLLLALLIGVGVGMVLGLIAGAIIGLLSEEVVNALLPWAWLLGGVTTFALMAGLLIIDQARVISLLSPILFPGGVLAGWIAKREYVRLGTQQATNRESISTDSIREAEVQE